MLESLIGGALNYLANGGAGGAAPTAAQPSTMNNIFSAIGRSRAMGGGAAGLFGALSPEGFAKLNPGAAGAMPNTPTAPSGGGIQWASNPNNGGGLKF